MERNTCNQAVAAELSGEADGLGEQLLTMSDLAQAVRPVGGEVASSRREGFQNAGSVSTAGR